MKLSSMSMLQFFLTNSTNLFLAALLACLYFSINSGHLLVSSNFLGISSNKSNSLNQSSLPSLYSVNKALNSGKAQ